jgi:23S rRNA (cytidine1920-2'-O)/16S rRNA (cytidine1409-2'-O)-methyltransferase
MGNSFVRLDKLLVDSGLTASRERAQALILAAKVLVDGQRVTKAGQKVAPDSSLLILGEDHPFVSRGGLKLRHALQVFRLEVTGLVAMDVGASTGGFTDCLLQYGAKRVYAVDVGYGQLAWKLRQDPRVVVLERQNIRYLPRDRIPETIHLATIDASFISLKLVLPSVVPFFAPRPPINQENIPCHSDLDRGSGLSTEHPPPTKAWLIALIKPQFEAGRAQVGKGGVVRDQKIHQAVCASIAEVCQSSGFEVGGITPSPILGPKGNVEFLLYATYQRPRQVG